MTKVGEVTDCQIIKTKKGTSRGFAYVGFRDIETATKAKEYFDQTFLLSSKISVSFSRPIGARELDDTWVRKHDGVVSRSWNCAADDDPLKGKTNRLFVTNIAYETTDDEVAEFFSQFGEVEEVILPIDTLVQRPKGFAIVTFASIESVETALGESLVMKGRHLQLSRGEIPDNQRRKSAIPDDDESFRDKKKRLMKEEKPASWNALFLNKNTIIEATANRLGFTKAQIMNPESEDLAQRLTIAESQIVKETKEMFEKAGIDLSAFDKPDYKLSRTLIIVKNLKYEVTEEEVTNMFAKYGTLVNVIFPPAHGSALVEYARPDEAKKAFRALSYVQVLDQPMLLQWAPASATSSGEAQEEEAGDRYVVKKKAEAEIKLKTTTLLVKNVPFRATKDDLYKIVNTWASLKGVRMPKKADGSGHRGFAFLDFNTKKEAAAALENLGNVHLYDRHLIVQPAERGRNVESLAQTDE